MIQQIRIENLSQLVPLFDQYMVFYEKESNPQKYEAYLRDRIEKNEASVFIAYDEDDLPIGFALNYYSFSSTALGKVIVLNDLYVSEAKRKKGIGQRLIERTFELARELGAVRVDLGTAKTNITAQGLYDKIGFVKDTEYYAYSYSL
ncbi:N-acetyltransferase family protein [Rubritalea sp.]|uniref:GNAT family N-acetyltransferase n=1 Tax=Rubritalea sp. TaxID=2109375 RepID=UPI003EF10C26